LVLVDLSDLIEILGGVLMIRGDKIEGKSIGPLKHIKCLKVVALLFEGKSSKVVEFIEELCLTRFEDGKVNCSRVGGDGLGVRFFIVQRLANHFV
jgi:hypothetical protein